LTFSEDVVYILLSSQLMSVVFRLLPFDES
jgi:hypothetical protein